MTREEAIKKIKDEIRMYDEDSLESVDWEECYEALKAEHCEDCISRQAVLEEISGNILKYEDGSTAIQIINDIKELPSVKPTRPKGEWIPVSERLPEDESAVLATIRWYDRSAKEYRHYCVLCNYRRGIQSHYKDTWTYEHDEFGEVEAEYGGEKIIAWMPLPEPYEPKKGDTE